MLILSRKSGQTIVIGNKITIKVIRTRNQRVCLGIEAPAEVPVWRTEVAAGKETSAGRAVWEAPLTRKVLCLAGKHLSHATRHPQQP